MYVENIEFAILDLSKFWRQKTNSVMTDLKKKKKLRTYNQEKKS